MERIPFRYLGHFVVVPVRLGAVDAEFVVDSGIGVTLISDSLAHALGCESTGVTVSGRRMSGQEVELPLSKLPSLELGGCRWIDLDVAVLDMGALAGMDGLSGFLSLSPFETTGVTIDYPSETLVVEEATSLAIRAKAGIPVPVEVERDGPSAVVYMSLELPRTGEPIRVEIDMGSDCLILDTAFATRLGVDLDAHHVKRVEGRDETGHGYTRFFTKLRGAVSPTEASEISQTDPDVMFQRIIHDGLLGTSFLRRFSVTFDLPNERVIFGSPADS